MALSTNAETHMGGIGEKIRKVLIDLCDVWQIKQTQTLTNKTLTSPAVTGLTGTLTSPTIDAPTITGAVSWPGATTKDVDIGTTWGAGLIGTGPAPKAYRRTENGVITTTYKIDLTGLTGKGTIADDCIGLKTGAADSYFDQYTIAAHGVIFKVEMHYLETPAGCGTLTEIDLSANAAAKEYDEAVGDVFLDSGLTAAGKTAQALLPGIVADHYMHLVEGNTNGDDTVFTAGQLIIKLYGHAALA